MYWYIVHVHVHVFSGHLGLVFISGFSYSVRSVSVSIQFRAKWRLFLYVYMYVHVSTPLLPQNFDTSDSKLRREFEQYGPIKKVTRFAMYCMYMYMHVHYIHVYMYSVHSACVQLISVRIHVSKLHACTCTCTCTLPWMWFEPTTMSFLDWHTIWAYISLFQSKHSLVPRLTPLAYIHVRTINSSVWPLNLLGHWKSGREPGPFYHVSDIRVERTFFHAAKS